TTLRLPGDVDSNSPAIWDLLEGQHVLTVFTSFAGQASLASGTRIARMGSADEVGMVSPPGNGVWMEAVVTDAGGTWYGYYHNEIPAEICGRPERTIPRIGAARSTDRGRTWENLGIVLEARPGTQVCDSPNQYFVGGVGDLSVMLDPASTTLYLFFSQYSREAETQGVAVGRLSWANRDQPVGRVEVWSDGVWLPARAVFGDAGEAAQPVWVYPSGTPLVTPLHPWHDADEANDAFWGASVHWNSYLQQYVMLLNRAKDEQFGQEGIYVSFASALDDPSLWSPPQRILDSGSWYPQVIGVAVGDGTDKKAGARARFFMGGVSDYLIEFSPGTK
ncbi:MAG: hypothetical protein OEW19_13345, partial [Acidobacteriota bacterium]|nr:hypothetical protein [Acidobacteriota bacterium]